MTKPAFAYLLRGGLAAVAVTMSLSAEAADLGRRAPSPVLAPPVLIDNSGLYVRVDTGFVYNPKVNAVALNDQLRYGPLDIPKLRNTALFGAGVGYRFNNWLRADVTVDTRTTSRFTSLDSPFTAPGAAYNPLYFDAKAQYRATVGLVNAYADLGTWYGITPYIGGGIGVASREVSKISLDLRTNVNAPACAVFPCGPGTLGAPITVPSSSTTAFAWALMAGAAIKLTDNLSLDAGYRYMNVGTYSSKFDSTRQVQAKLKNLDAHEAHIGLRWSFANEVAPVSAPLVRKY
jgi:opacity protein-like surface antigen